MPDYFAPPLVKSATFPFLFMPDMSPLIENPAALVQHYPKAAVTVDCVLFGFDEGQLKILLIRSDLEQYKDQWSLLGDIVLSEEDLDTAAYRVLSQRTGLDNIFLEQVKSFSHPRRHPGGRVITVAYCSLINVQEYKLSIEDHELHWHSMDTIQQLAFDHMDILQECHRWLQKQVLDSALAFKLLPETFSLRDLQSLYETILNVRLDRRNFRKKLFSMDFLEDTGIYESGVPHRPGKLYRFHLERYQRNLKKME